MSLPNDTTLNDLVHDGSPSISATVHPIPQGVTLANEAVARGGWPAVLVGHSGRSGSATSAFAET